MHKRKPHLSGCLLAAILIFLVLAFAGCPSSKYVPCCVKDRLYNSTTQQMLANPMCYFENGSRGDNGGCMGGSVGKKLLEKGLAACSQGKLCGQLNEEECGMSYNCIWNSSQQSCTPPTDSAYVLMPVCVDAAPQSCVNNRCTAMVCGASEYNVESKASARDWKNQDATKAMPSKEMSNTPNVNLQGTSCEFRTMDRKLYNEVRQSKGSLWVNAFRFGVGRSFSDYEQAKYFFPASDRLCGFNPSGTVDRFTAYLNVPNTWCAKLSSNNYPVYFHCASYNLNFTNQTKCSIYCDGKAPPDDCNIKTASSTNEQYVCLLDQFAYSSKQACMEKCPIIDPSVCTTSSANAPFLKPDGRYPVAYVADYMTGANTVAAQCPDGRRNAWKNVCWADEWKLNEPGCGDYFLKEGPIIDGPWYYMGNNYYGWRFENGKSVALSFDYDYYAIKLKKQYKDAGYDMDKRLPFECNNSLQCISGACDKTKYTRGLCINKSNGATIDCGCGIVRKDGKVQLKCEGIPDRFYAKKNNGEMIRVSSEMFTKEHEFSRTENPAEVKFVYYLEEGEEGSPVPKVFEKCGLVHVNTVSGCIDEGYFSIICPSDLSNFRVYEITFSSSATSAALGNCLLDDDYKTNLPYLKIGTYGWCAGCTYATLAVQKITWSDVPGGPSANGQMQGSMENYGCYEFRGYKDYNFGQAPTLSLRDLNGDGKRDGSTAEVTASMTRDPYNGNIGARMDHPDCVACCDERWFLCEDGWVTQTSCVDGHCRDTNWWTRNFVYPSPPYLRDKLATYLQSNVMPVLDVSEAGTDIKIEDRYVPRKKCEQKTGKVYKCSYESRTYGPYLSCPSGYPCYGNCVESFTTGWACSLTGLVHSSASECYDFCYGRIIDVPVKTLYAPVDICTKYGGDGSAIYVVGSTSLIGSSSTQNIFADEPLANYLRGDVKPIEVSGGTYYKANGTAQLIARAIALKEQCPTKPLVGLAITPSDTRLDILIGRNLYNQDSPQRGKLHKFFYKNGTDPVVYSWKVSNAVVDEYPGKIDLLLQEWYPRCTGAGKEKEEIEGRIAFSRALLGNFSKPSLIWRFHFPIGTSCNYDVFMDYLFNNTGRMVDAGIIGIIYDSWATPDGRGYGPISMTVNGSIVHTGLNDLIAEGALDSPTGRANTPFCAVQKYSKAVMGLTEYSYGRKLYAENKTCFCEPCTPERIAAGVCSENAQDNPIPAQAYCNDGTVCALPSGWTNYSKYFCPDTCVNYTACKLCPSFGNKKSVCRIEQVGEAPFLAERKYSELNETSFDDDWAFVAGLPAKDKCCVEKQEPERPVQKYTYAIMNSQKQRSEFLQFPRRGEEGIDCGRTPDTSVLVYCGVRIPLSQQKISCFGVG
ncbi:MAG: hypothetical protein N3G22_03930 [Candidatus Micrarchaeota archaeon]|nr:hypothetical protein [Candidatus Micrarchaeota archaeon]